MSNLWAEMASMAVMLLVFYGMVMQLRVRTKKKLKGSLTAKEKLALHQHNQAWVQNALRTDSVDVPAITDAIERLYELAGLKKPRVVVVPSPLVMMFAYGAAAAIWRAQAGLDDTNFRKYQDLHKRAHDVASLARHFMQGSQHPVRGTAEQVVHQVIDSVTNGVEWNGDSSAMDAGAADSGARMHVREAPFSRITEEGLDLELELILTPQDADDQTHEVTAILLGQVCEDKTSSNLAADIFDRTSDVTQQVSDVVTDLVVYDALVMCIEDMLADVIELGQLVSAEYGAARACFQRAGLLGLACADEWQNSYQGGAYAAGEASLLTAYRDVMGLDLPEFVALRVYEDCAQAPFRVMHPEFCLVSDFPETLKLDDHNRPHCEDGPSHRWRDGWELYHWHGVRVPPEWIWDKASLTPERALTWENLEQRRAACEILGWHTILEQLETTIIDTDTDPQIGQLLEVDLPDMGRERFLKVQCATGRTFALAVPPEMDTALQANAWTYGLEGDEYKQVEVRT